MKKSAKKIEKKPKIPKVKEPMSPEKKLAMKVVLVFAVLGMLLCAVIFGAIYLYKAVCTENSNYLLRHVEVDSSGYWDGRDELVAAFLRLKINKDNIFKLDLEQIKKQALRIPGVKECEVRRLLPDTLQFNFIERVPRARISGHPSYLVDEHGIILFRKYCMQHSQNLVMLTGINPKRKFSVNTQAEDLVNAMQISLLALRYHSDIEIVAMDVSNKDFLKLYVRYAKGKLRQAIMPNDLNGADLRLKALRTALIRSHNANDGVKLYNLSFDGRVICQ